MNTSRATRIKNFLNLMSTTCFHQILRLSQNISKNKNDIQMCSKEQDEIPKISNLIKRRKRRTETQQRREGDSIKRIFNWNSFTKSAQQFRCDLTHTIFQKVQCFVCTWIPFLHVSRTQLPRKSSKTSKRQNFWHFVQKHTTPLSHTLCIPKFTWRIHECDQATFQNLFSYAFPERKIRRERSGYVNRYASISIVRAKSTLFY